MKKIGRGILAVLIAAYVALIAYAYWPKPAGTTVAALATADDKFITVDGLSIRYRTYGSQGDGRPNLVLMHGFGNSLQSFRNLAPLLADCCFVMALDFPGYGLSSIPVAYDYGNFNQAKTAIAVVRALKIADPVYIGHSMGGAIALQAGVADPNARGMVLIDPGILETGVPRAMTMAPFPFPRISAKLFGDRAWRERFLKLSFIDPSFVTDAVMDDLMRTPARDDYWAGATTMMGSFRPGDEPELLAKVKVPVLIVFGEADRNHPATLRAQLHDGLPGSQMIVVAGAGHYPHEEKAPEVAEAIKTMAGAWGLSTPRRPAEITAPQYY